MWKLAGIGLARGDRAEFLGPSAGGTVVLHCTVWPCYSSGLLHGFVKIDFVDGFGGDWCSDVLWRFFEEYRKCDINSRTPTWISSDTKWSVC